MIGDQVELICATLAPLQAVQEILALAEAVLIRGDLVPGCSIAAVALAAEDPDGALRAAADLVFTRWEHALASCLGRAGVSAESAANYATTAMAGIEGGVILCRARGNAAPFAQVRAGLLDHLRAISTA
jgi:TetR/AcrR family transcriptional repressor of lmrAB and yxaGH operons